MMRWMAFVLLCALAFMVVPTSAQDVWVGGRLEAGLVIPDGGEARLGLGPDSVLNLEMGARENLDIVWEFNIARELGSPVSQSLSSPFFAAVRDQYFARMKNLGGMEGLNVTVGQFENIIGLASLGRQDRCYDDFDFGIKVQRPWLGYQLSATVTDAHNGMTPQYFLRAEGTVATISGSIDAAWGNGNGLFAIAGERNIADRLRVQAEYVSGDFTNNTQLATAPPRPITHRFLYLAGRYQLQGPWAASIRFRDGKRSDSSATVVKYGVHYQVDKDTQASLEWWNFSSHFAGGGPGVEFPSQIVLQVGTNF